MTQHVRIVMLLAENMVQMVILVYKVSNIFVPLSLFGTVNDHIVAYLLNKFD